MLFHHPLQGFLGVAPQNASTFLPLRPALPLYFVAVCVDIRAASALLRLSVLASVRPRRCGAWRFLPRPRSALEPAAAAETREATRSGQSAVITQKETERHS